MARIVTYAHRYKRPPRKKKAAAIATAIVKAPTKGERIRRREAADADDAGRERSPEEREEREEEARAEVFLRRMMRPR
jgi:hypothetical protein